MTRRVKSAVFRVPLVILGGLVLGLLGAFAGLVYHQVEATAAATDPQCTNAAGTETITLNGGTVTLSNIGGSLNVEPYTASVNPCSAAVGSLGGSITSIAFDVGTTASEATTVVLDETDTGGLLPCLPMTGAVGNTTTGNGTVNVLGRDGQSITVGSTGLNLQPGSCNVNEVVALDNVAAYDLSDTSGVLVSPVTFSAAGDATTGGPATVPVTFVGGAATPATHHLNGSTFIGGSLTDTYTVFGNGNTFRVGTGTDTITDTDTVSPPTNALDFSNVQASASSHLVVNVSGTTQTVGTTVKDGQAALGSVISDTFNSSAFAVIKGASSGDTDFLAGDHGGLTFTAQGASGNAADFSAASSGVVVNLTQPAGTVSGGNLTNGGDTVSGLTNVTGSAAGGNEFVAGSGSPYTFTGNGNGNIFVGGASGADTFTSNGTGNLFFPGVANASFIDPTAGNTVDLDSVAVTASAIVNVSGVPVTGAANDTATAAGSTYTFTQLAEPTTLIGSTGGTTFFAGTGADTFEGVGAGSNELSFASTSGASSLAVSLVTGHAVLGGVTEFFSNIKTFDSLAVGNTTFVSGGAAGDTFNATGTGDTMNYGPDTNPVTANLTAGSVSDTGGGAADTINGISTVFGSSGGANTFIAGSGSETFGDTGSAGGDTVSFVNVPTSGSTPLTVNVSGSPVGVTATSTATAGPATYTFSNKVGNFSIFDGSNSGNTLFFGGTRGGLTFTAQALTLGNSADFSPASSGLRVNLNAALGNVTGGGLSAADTLQNLTSVKGSSAGGSTFAGGSAGPYTFTGQGSGNTFDAAGAGLASSATFIDPSPGNTVDLSPLSQLQACAGAAAPCAAVNVSGVQVSATGNHTATTLGGATYTFIQLAEPDTFVGSVGGTTFYAGSSADTFTGQGLAADTLTFAFVSGGPLSINLLSHHAVLGGVTEPFSNIKTFDSLAAGNTTFVSAGAAGDTFTATGTGNSADYSSDTHPVTADLSAGTVSDTGGGAPDAINGISTVFGSIAGANDFIAGSGSETFGDTGSTGGDTVNFVHVPTSGSSPLTVNVSGSPVGVTATSTATAGSALYTFSNRPGNFAIFDGSNSGNTLFVGGTRGGLTFSAQAFTLGNSADFSAASSGLTVDLAVPIGNVTGGGLSAADTLQNLTNVTGSAAGGSTFAGGSDGPYTFTGHASGNTFDAAGTGSASSATFIDPLPNNKIDLSPLSQLQACAGAAAPCATLDVSGVQVAATGNHTATTLAGATYTFTGLTEPATFVGSLGGTTFYAGSSSDTFTGQGLPSDTLSFAFASGGPLSINLLSHHAVLGGVTEPFSNIKTFDGLAAGSTTFVSGGAAGDTFMATGSGNSADYSSDTHPVKADLSAGSVSDTGGGAADTINGISTVLGSTLGGNDFRAGLGSETFEDTGSPGADTVDFTNAQASQTDPLTVNVSALPVNGTNPATATAGTATYTFNNKAANFTKFIGANTGFSRFDANATTGGYNFRGNGFFNTADFSATSGIQADLTVATGNVTGLGASPSLSTPDSITGAFLVAGENTVVGSSSGSNLFYGDLVGTSFTAQNPGANNSNTVSYLHVTSFPAVVFNLDSAQISATGAVPDLYSFSPSAKLIAQGSPGNDSFVVGISLAAIQGGGGDDGLDVSFVPGSSSGPTGVTVDLNGGTVRSPSATTVATFAPGCTSATVLCVASVNGSAFNDTYVANAQALSGAISPVDITGNGGTDALNVSHVSTTAATICMPIDDGTSPLGSPPCTATGFVSAGVAQPPAGTPGITFTGIANVTGTQLGGDYVYDGNGSSTFLEPGKTATLDFSNLPLSTNAQPTIPGAVVVATTSPLGTQAGSASSQFLGIDDTFSGFGKFVGTQGNDSFAQSGSGTYTFSGGLGVNALDLSGATAQAAVSLQPPASGECSSGPGFTNTDGSVVLTGVLADHFSCISTFTSPSTSTFQASPAPPGVTPGQTATVNGGGSGTLDLINDVSDSGATVNLVKGWVTGDRYNFQFSGMSTIEGTPFNDTFIPGSTNVTLVGGGGQDGLSYLGGTVPGTSPALTYAGAPGAVDVNLATSSYLIPTGMPNAGTTVPPCTATGGYGGTISMTGCTISNVTGTSTFADALVGGQGSETLSGGSGRDRFVLTNGGRTTIVGGTGSSTLDLSQLSGGGVTTFALGDPSTQALPDLGSVQVISGNITTVMASPGGSDLTAGFGTVTLMGGPGNDVLAAGTASAGQTQTLIGGGGNDTLVGGIGTDLLEGGNQPVTFQPGEGTDTLMSPVAGNTLSYAAASMGIRANLSSDQVVVPPGKPFANAVLSPQTVTGGFPGSTVILSGARINHLVGTPLTDVLVTSGSNDNISGGGGSDLFIMQNGNNTVTEPAGSSADFLFNGAGSSSIQGGGSGTLDFSQAPAGVVVNLQDGTATGGFGGTQSFTGIKNVFGTVHNFKDILVAGPPGGKLVGAGTGSDVLQAGPSGGDTLIGGNGDTTFCSESDCAVSGTATAGGATAATENHMTGGLGNDSFFVANHAFDAINGGGGFDNVAEVDHPQDTAVHIQRFLP